MLQLDLGAGGHTHRNGQVIRFQGHPAAGHERAAVHNGLDRRNDRVHRHGRSQGAALGTLHAARQGARNGQVARSDSNVSPCMHHGAVANERRRAIDQGVCDDRPPDGEPGPDLEPRRKAADAGGVFCGKRHPPFCLDTAPVDPGPHVPDHRVDRDGRPTGAGARTLDCAGQVAAPRAVEGGQVHVAAGCDRGSQNGGLGCFHERVHRNGTAQAAALLLVGRDLRACGQTGHHGHLARAQRDVSARGDSALLDSGGGGTYDGVHSQSRAGRGGPGRLQGARNGGGHRAVHGLQVNAPRGGENRGSCHGGIGLLDRGVEREGASHGHALFAEGSLSSQNQGAEDGLVGRLDGDAAGHPFRAAHGHVVQAPLHPVDHHADTQGPAGPQGMLVLFAPFRECGLPGKRHRGDHGPIRGEEGQAVGNRDRGVSNQGLCAGSHRCHGHRSTDRGVLGPGPRCGHGGQDGPSVGLERHLVDQPEAMPRSRFGRCREIDDLRAVGQGVGCGLSQLNPGLIDLDDVIGPVAFEAADGREVAAVVNHPVPGLQAVRGTEVDGVFLRVHHAAAQVGDSKRQVGAADKSIGVADDHVDRNRRAARRGPLVGVLARTALLKSNAGRAGHAPAHGSVRGGQHQVVTRSDGVRGLCGRARDRARGVSDQNVDRNGEGQGQVPLGHGSGHGLGTDDLPIGGRQGDGPRHVHVGVGDRGTRGPGVHVQGEGGPHSGAPGFVDAGPGDGLNHFQVVGLQDQGPGGGGHGAVVQGCAGVVDHHVHRTGAHGSGGKIQLLAFLRGLRVRVPEPELPEIRLRVFVGILDHLFGRGLGRRCSRSDDHRGGPRLHLHVPGDAHGGRVDGGLRGAHKGVEPERGGSGQPPQQTGAFVLVGGGHHPGPGHSEAPRGIVRRHLDVPGRRDLCGGHEGPGVLDQDVARDIHPGRQAEALQPLGRLLRGFARGLRSFGEELADPSPGLDKGLFQRLRHRREPVIQRLFLIPDPLAHSIAKPLDNGVAAFSDVEDALGNAGEEVVGLGGGHIPIEPVLNLVACLLGPGRNRVPDLLLQTVPDLLEELAHCARGLPRTGLLGACQGDGQHTAPVRRMHPDVPLGRHARPFGALRIPPADGGLGVPDHHVRPDGQPGPHILPGAHPAGEVDQMNGVQGSNQQGGVRTLDHGTARDHHGAPVDPGQGAVDHGDGRNAAAQAHLGVGPSHHRGDGDLVDHGVRRHLEGFPVNAGPRSNLRRGLVDKRVRERGQSAGQTARGAARQDKPEVQDITGRNDAGQVQCGHVAPGLDHDVLCGGAVSKVLIDPRVLVDDGLARVHAHQHIHRPLNRLHGSSAGVLRPRGEQPPPKTEIPEELVADGEPVHDTAHEILHLLHADPGLVPGQGGLGENPNAFPGVHGGVSTDPRRGLVHKDPHGGASAEGVPPGAARLLAAGQAGEDGVGGKHLRFLAGPGHDANVPLLRHHHRVVADLGQAVGHMDGRRRGTGQGKPIEQRAFVLGVLLLLEQLEQLCEPAGPHRGGGTGAVGRHLLRVGIHLPVNVGRDLQVVHRRDVSRHQGPRCAAEDRDRGAHGQPFPAR